MTSPYPSSAGRLCVWDVGPCGNRHHRGPANRRRPLQHQDDSPQKEEQLQAPEEEGQTARGQYLYLSLVITCYNSYWGSILHWVLSLLFFPPQQPREPGTSRQDQAMLLADSSEDEFWRDPFELLLSVTNGWCCCKGGSANKPIAMTTASRLNLGCLAMTHLIHRMWQSVGHNLHRLHKGQLCNTPLPPFLKVPMWALFWMLSGDVDSNGLAGPVWCTCTVIKKSYCCS